MAQNQLRPEQSQFLTDVRQILLDLSRRLQQDVGDDVVDYALFRLQQLSRHLARFAHAAQVYEEVQADLDMIASLLTEADRNFPCHYVGLNAGSSYSGGLGRPRMEISREQLEYLVENDISIPDIAQVLGVSVSTVKRRLREFGISSTERKTPISDTDLDAAVQGIQRMFPNAGYRRVQSKLFLNGIKVAQRRVREAMHRTDPEGVAMRWLSITPRGVYCVSGPLALWHIDGNHKLIR